MMQFQQGAPFTSPAVDELLCCLADGRNVPLTMDAAGYTVHESSRARHDARLAGYIQASHPGQDRLTPAGRARVNQINAPRGTRQTIGAHASSAIPQSTIHLGRPS